MSPNLFPNLTILYTIVIIVILAYAPASWCDDDQRYAACGELFGCGNIQGIGYPFWGQNRAEYCGHPQFRLNCTDGVLQITIQPIQYRVLAMDNRTRSLTVARGDFANDLCPQYLYNTSLDPALFTYATNDPDVTLYYGCPEILRTPVLPNQFDCNVNGSESFSYFMVSNSPVNFDSGACRNNIVVRVNRTTSQLLGGTSASTALLQSALADGFGLIWDANSSFCGLCVQSEGRCGYNQSSNSFACYCRDGPHNFTCNNATGNSSSKNTTPMNVGLGIAGAVLAGIGIGWLFFFCRQRRKRIAAQSAQSAQNESKDLLTIASSKSVSTPTPSTNSTQSIPSYPSSKSDLGNGSTYFGVQVFSYTELEEATDNFNSSRELGDGGFGTVYYGKLHDGRAVAVKRLYENNFKRMEQFMNEVEILTRLRHQNLVKLYGCTSKRSRELLLVYEYIPNGTVADHLHGKRAKSDLLSWPVRLNIAVETAAALSYLHESDIIHRDVKTTNILLDNDFSVKVADFGLSRLFPNDVTHVSTAPQGTPGYVDPEYYQCYRLTEKSDVYSFGVVLIELISSLQAVDTNRHRTDINLANMAVNKIQNHTLNELVDPSLGFEANNYVRRMTTLVAELAFQCLQQERDMRPSMKDLLQALRGIQNEVLGAQKGEVLDILVDDVALLKNDSPGTV